MAGQVSGHRARDPRRDARIIPVARVVVGRGEPVAAGSGGPGAARREQQAEEDEAALSALDFNVTVDDGMGTGWFG